MQKIRGQTAEGANAYLKQQYTTVCRRLAAFVCRSWPSASAAGCSPVFAFATGGVFSMLAGLIGMKHSRHQLHRRTAQAASESLNRGLRVAFSSALSWALRWWPWGGPDITMWFFILRFGFGVTNSVAAGQHHGHESTGRSLHGAVRRVGGGMAAVAGRLLWARWRGWSIPGGDSQSRNPATIAIRGRTWPVDGVDLYELC